MRYCGTTPNWKKKQDSETYVKPEKTKTISVPYAGDTEKVSQQRCLQRLTGEWRSILGALEFKGLFAMFRMLGGCKNQFVRLGG